MLSSEVNCIFIRSMATRGSLGGLARATADVILALDAAGFERVLVETVGVGQAEVEIASTAHTTIVVEAPFIWRPIIEKPRAAINSSGGVEPRKSLRTLM